MSSVGIQCHAVVIAMGKNAYASSLFEANGTGWNRKSESTAPLISLHRARLHRPNTVDRESLDARLFRTELGCEKSGAQLPHRGKVLAPRVFHGNRNAVAPTVFYLNLDSAVQAFVPLVLRWSYCAIEKVFATKIVNRSHFHFASILFHAFILVFAIIVAPDRFLNELS